ncbi:hypothetical protein GCK32_010956 [Trichostrongylus colubriformis]|uniref:Uncharacterized protein n=1 Tax=Trichostrongylus colubriformis TaxID=6319 RepID=A0AAN8EZA4_TRICO
MLIWLLIPVVKVLTRPFPRMPVAAANTTQESIATDANETLIEAITVIERNRTNFKNFIDPSIFISLRQNDWRDNHQTKMIIWSLESPHHPDFGKSYSRGRSQRMNTSSQVMSFLILGSVIGFILYTYLAHVITMRKLNRESKAAQLRELVHRLMEKALCLRKKHAEAQNYECSLAKKIL